MNAPPQSSAPSGRKKAIGDRSLAIGDSAKPPPVLVPFSRRGGLGEAHQLFGKRLPKLLAELNDVLVA